MRVLFAVVRVSRALGRPASRSDAEVLEAAGGNAPRLESFLRTLANRWLIVIDGTRLRPRADGVRVALGWAKSRPASEGLVVPLPPPGGDRWLMRGA